MKDKKEEVEKNKKEDENKRVENHFENIPHHVGIIMDGNGRWAQKRGLPRTEGHREGAKSVDEIVETAREIGIKYLTLYTFSKDNWKRPKEEISLLMQLLKEHLIKQREKMRKNGIKFNVVGDIRDLPKDIREEIKKTKDYTKDCKDMVLTLALSYSGRQEIVKATKKIAEMVKNKRLKISEIDQELFTKILRLPDVDLLIRTSGEMRISDFLLWHIPYAEIYITPTLWPDFRKAEFLKAIEWFKTRERKFGMTSEQIRQIKQKTKNEKNER
jgi:undecaprenyl diphosphate synthase